ncbi:MAG: hypothetical protein HPY71_16115 [Firmicutes bacterium]|nr:hypothetical protein [Bacillota bacterium]
MNFLVLIKQVPDTNEVKMDEATGTMIREGVGAIINPLDLHALEEALLLRERFGGKVTVLSMGPPRAIEAIREAVAMGADDGILLSDRKFGGSDTLATSYALASAIKKIGCPDIILAGERATDGETGQVGPEVAVMLGLPFVTYVSRIESVSPLESIAPGVGEGSVDTETTVSSMPKQNKYLIRLRRIVESGYEIVEATLPILLTVVKEINDPRMPTLSGKIRAKSVQVPVWSPQDIGVHETMTGLAGSPTRVVKVFYPKITRNGRILKTSEHSPEECIKSLLEFLEDRAIFRENGKTTLRSDLATDREIPEAPSHTIAHFPFQSLDASKSVTSQDKGLWVLGEARDGAIHEVTFELLNKGRDLADKLHAYLGCVLIGYNIDDAEEVIYRGADRLFIVDHPGLEHFLVEPYLNILEFLTRTYMPEILIAGATSMGRTLMPALAARLRTGLTADCTELDIDRESGLLLQTRPAIGGNVMATIKTPEARPQMATFRPRTVGPASRDTTRGGEIIHIGITGEGLDDKSPQKAQSILKAMLDSRVRFVELIKDALDEVNIQDADIVISGGRGITRGENFRLIYELSSLFREGTGAKAGVGASRAVVDQGWISYSHQVGLSGKTVSPKLYMAIGVSGSVQHIAGMQTSELVVAINKDPDAPIFKVADFGIVGNLFDIVPLLIEKLKGSYK